MNIQRFAGQVALITGAGRGIGKATAERFAAEGAKVALLSNELNDLKQTESELLSRGATVIAIQVDVSDAEQVQEAIDRTVSALGRIDIVVNNAGIAWEEPFVDIKEANWCKIIDVNLNGMFHVAQRTARQMIAQNEGGVILNMASTNGLVGEANYAHYNASKGGVVLLTKTMAIELGIHNIRVNAVCPGYIQTPMSEAIDDEEKVLAYVRDKIPLNRRGRVTDISGVFAFLASEDASFITGESIVVDGGQLAF
ncbi:SDR family NAD(P)-dependent oxidoreductase [Paenibacillus sp. HJGM_3]|uniref:SDR family NAD(P)-dependent oxidoreductase n=1 Tax=Paenibacillus sp. HJGM_3 TaxID=3379816 RepID=UPI00385A479C